MKDICAYEECKKEFVKTTHNQKYCCDACCRTATNLKIRQKYYENKDRLSGKERKCSSRGCKNLLSRYNSGKICQQCEAKLNSTKRRNILGIIGNVAG